MNLYQKMYSFFALVGEQSVHLLYTLLQALYDVECT